MISAQPGTVGEATAAVEHAAEISTLANLHKQVP